MAMHVHHPVSRTVSRNIRDIRRARGLTQAEAAKRVAKILDADTWRAVLWSWIETAGRRETDRPIRHLDPDELTAIAEALECTVLDLFGTSAATLAPRGEGQGGPRWRTGRKVGRTIYREAGFRASDDDALIGVMDTPELATQVVVAVNRYNQ